MPDFSHHESSLKYEAIYDRGNDDIVRLDTPEYYEYVVRSENRGYPTKSFHTALNKMREYSGGGQHEVDIIGLRTEGEQEVVYHLPASFRNSKQ